ncbi:MAG: endopeptidase La [Rhodoferax sp.]|uniref:endopeptidase La n=1 Tax=Rhodoferax sp. TaxID=50421 RepID=UPI0026090684|nr:endopeptidase La [Rhodoferax sp.]MDD2879299.1 endopeptidase La [Rhodoferax sp.]
MVILPVRNMVMFPGLIVPIGIGRESSINAAQYAVKTERPVGILMQRNPDADVPTADDLSTMGTVAAILRYATSQDGTHHIICQGQQRFRVLGYLPGFDFTVARVERIREDSAGISPEDKREIEARFLQLKARATEVLQLLPGVPHEMLEAVKNIEAPGMLADLVAGYVDIKATEKQELLEEIDLRRRLDRVIDMLVHRIEVLNLSRDIDQRTKASIGEREREFLLREQLKTIQKKLGEGGADNSAELDDLKKLIDEANMPADVEKQAVKEFKRLERMSDNSTEYSMVRTYLDWLVELPWKTPAPDDINVARARQVLDEDHFGLEAVKKRILEFLAVRKLKPGGHGPILCLAGPPGVGKTSLGQSIARALGRKFVRVSLGGVHDEAEIRGHRRTYIGALPGNIIQALKKAGTRGCVMMLDEIDKLGTGIHGDPSAAMLEVLDPEQNNTFRDNYLAVPFDLSQVIFIATANMLDPIPGPLRDRMEVLHLAGYTQEEKLEIAKRYLVHRQFEANGLRPEQLTLTDEALMGIIRRYTREAGVRNLERQIGAVCRHVAVRLAEGSAQSQRVDAPDLSEILGQSKFESDVALRAGMTGVATGLAWTPVGGDILFIEATRTPGSARLILTGQLGDVMKESAQAALTLVKSRALALNLAPAVFEKADVHIHVPAGAVPKDGPSAGVAMFIALASLFTGQPVRSHVAMTGEISLRGLVLPVGGIKEKVLAALAAGIKTVMLPARNRADLEEVPAQAKAQLEFIFLDNVEEALLGALGLAAPEQRQVALL